MVLIGCTVDDPATLRKASVAADMLEAGVTVSIQGSVGSVSVPFTEEIPDVSASDFQDELDGAVSLLVTSTVSGASADIVSGTLVDGMPAAAGEFSFEIAADRMSVTMSFFNETSSGLTLKAGNTYSAQLSISINEYVNRQPALEFDVTAE